MNTSAPSASPSRNIKLETERTALRQLFWKEDVMALMRAGNYDTFQINIPHSMSAQELMEMVFGSGPIERLPDDHVTFMLSTFNIGDEMWGGIAAGLNFDAPLRIIEPFHMPDRTVSGIPLFKEEL